MVIDTATLELIWRRWDSAEIMIGPIITNETAAYQYVDVESVAIVAEGRDPSMAQLVLARSKVTFEVGYAEHQTAFQFLDVGVAMVLCDQHRDGDWSD